MDDHAVELSGESQQKQQQSGLSEEFCRLTEPFLPSPEFLINNDDQTARSDSKRTDITAFDQTVSTPVTRDDQNFINTTTLSTTEYQLDPNRYVVLVVFSLANLLACAAWITFAPIDDVMISMYSITPQQVNWLSLIFMALYGPGTAVCAWGIRKFGLRVTVVASAVVMALGGLMRWGSILLIRDDNHRNSMAYPVLLAGQALVAMAQPVFSNAPARVASAWFQQTAGAIGFIVFGAMVGMVLGQAMSPFMSGSVGELLAWQALAMIGCAVASYFYFETEPKSPPTASEALRRLRQHEECHQHGAEDDSRTFNEPSAASSTWHEMQLLLSDTQYLVLLVSFGIQFALNNALLTLLQPWIAFNGFPGDFLAGACGTLAIIGGILGTLIAAPLLDKTQEYNKAIRWSFFASFLVMVGVVYVLQPKSKDWVVMSAFFLMGMSQFPMLPICLDAAAAHTYPVSEEISSAGLQFVGQYLGIVLTDGMEYMLKHNKSPSATGSFVGFSAPVNLGILGIMLLSTVVALPYTGKDRRAAVLDENQRSTVEAQEDPTL